MRRAAERRTKRSGGQKTTELTNDVARRFRFSKWLGCVEPKQNMTKAQAHRSSKLKGYYDRQYAVTASNKARRAAKRARRKVKGERLPGQPKT